LSKLLALVPALMLPSLAVAATGAPVEPGRTLGQILPLWSMIPFVGLLLSIAVLPIVVEHWWEHTRNQLLVALGWASPVFAFLLYSAATNHLGVGHDAGHTLLHAVEEYVSYMALLGSLYVISGGIVLRGDLAATPTVNLLFLGSGAILANVIGTTGASMLLIRPLLRTNSERNHTWHIPLFFIFVVANVGGALTPIGDPPLFLGYLRGVPFFWTVTNLWHIWVPTVLVLLAIFFVVDTVMYRREAPEDHAIDLANIEPLGVDGKRNFWLLGGVILAVLFLSPNPTAHDFRDFYAREIAMFGLAAFSVFGTPTSYRERNDFTYGPILEVAALFVGIFIAMIPATEILQTRGARLGLDKTWQYFWATGLLSAFLDNAPTYITFAAMGCGTDPTCVTAENLHPLAVGPFAHVLMAVSLGAVFMGAGSYIGNGPNFMVRSIAEDAGFKMPTFFGYIGWAVVILGPVFAGVTLIWFL